jgi:predicted DNA-binding transcriptional regulator AlpA
MAKLSAETPQFGMSRAQAAHHIGIGMQLFDGLVREGKVPPPRKIGSRLIWLRQEVEEAIESLPYTREWYPPAENALKAALALQDRHRKARRKV